MRMRHRMSSSSRTVGSPYRIRRVGRVRCFVQASLPESIFDESGAGEGVPPFNPLLNNGADALCLPTM